jgi:hypothetical protein
VNLDAPHTDASAGFDLGNPILILGFVSILTNGAIPIFEIGGVFQVEAQLNYWKFGLAVFDELE